jgi:GT2 family glycosyltransferase
MVAQDFPAVHLIRNRKNIGFGAANNQALARAQGEFLIFLNDDTEIIDHALDKMVHFLEQHREFGIIGARLLNPDRTWQRGTARRFPTFKVLATMLLGLHSFLLKKEWLRDYYLLESDFTKLVEVDQVMGASLMTRKSLLDRLGGFDEKFWIWFEEVDLCKRFKEAGHKIAVLGSAEIIHHQGQSFIRHIKLRRYFQLARSMLIYSRKHLLPWHFLELACLWPLGLLVALLVQIMGLKPKKLA